MSEQREGIPLLGPKAVYDQDLYGGGQDGNGRVRMAIDNEDAQEDHEDAL